MAKERPEIGGLTEDGLLAKAADELVQRWKADKVHKRIGDSESDLGSRKLEDLIIAQKEGVLSDGELQGLKRLRMELIEEANRILDELLRRNPHLRRPTEIQRGEWIEGVLLKFNGLIVS
ncbi:MAG: hypothetical protein HY980_01925 [Candidatus Magasanikbacteria bacterium]|nr:hypothetical protein [Candidatus Magasanikbacteria bacterium]